MRWPRGGGGAKKKVGSSSPTASSKLNGHKSCHVSPLSPRHASCRPADTAEGTSAAGATRLPMGRPFQARTSKVFGYVKL